MPPAFDPRSQARATSHPWANAKYCLLAGNFSVSPIVRNKKARNAEKHKLGCSKILDDACKAFDIDCEATYRVEELCPALVERLKRPQHEEAAEAFGIAPAALAGEGENTLPVD